MYSINDICQELDLEPKKLRRLIRRHGIAATTGSRYAFDESAYEAIRTLTKRSPKALPADEPGVPLRELQAARWDPSLRQQHKALYQTRQERLLKKIKAAGL